MGSAGQRCPVDHGLALHQDVARLVTSRTEMTHLLTDFPARWSRLSQLLDLLICKPSGALTNADRMICNTCSLVTMDWRPYV